MSTGDFSGTKIVGDNKESIGLSGDGKIHLNDDSNVNKTIEVNNGCFKFHEGFILGVGFIFKTRQVIFTCNGKELKCVDLPTKLANKILYPAISLASRENHKVKVKYLFGKNIESLK